MVVDDLPEIVPVEGLVVDSPASSEWRAWLTTPRPARAYAVCLVLGAAATATWGARSAGADDGQRLLALVVGAVASVEFGRRAEGGRVEAQRMHKGLSAWPFAAALITAPGLAAPIAAIVYLHAYLRGIRVTRWKWIGSWAIVTLAATAAGAAVQRIGGGRLARSGDWSHVAAIVAGVGVFVAVEAALFLVISRLNDEEDERYLRAHLARSSFYVIEAGVLACGAVAALLALYSPAAGILAFPAYLLLQRGLLHEPLQYEARHDTKTGALTWERWLASAATTLRNQGDGIDAAVVLVDLDHFKSVNDLHGHLAGDAVLTSVARAVSSCVRASDLVGRFGGDEFCVLLGSTSREGAAAIADRMRVAVSEAASAVAGVDVTVSVGVAVRADRAVGVVDLVGAADAALYRAKHAGRDRIDVVDATVHIDLVAACD